ncbi:MAG: hypothetical protein IKA96_00360 [Alistipes sp.]|nr:hypothetical protein [Alistipes sp.]
MRRASAVAFADNRTLAYNKSIVHKAFNSQVIKLLAYVRTLIAKHNLLQHCFASDFCSLSVSFAFLSDFCKVASSDFKGVATMRTLAREYGRSASTIFFVLDTNVEHANVWKSSVKKIFLREIKSSFLSHSYEPSVKSLLDKEPYSDRDGERKE